MRKYMPILAFLVAAPVHAATHAVDGLLQDYRTQGAGEFSAPAGRTAWGRTGKDGRTCADCHGDDLTGRGSHARTGKAIKPLAPSTNRHRLADGAKVEKWFKRNCTWTWGRECSPQEKGDFLVWMRTL